MNIIERLDDSELYVDAIDDAIEEIKRLRRRVEVWKVAAKVYYSHSSGVRAHRFSRTLSAMKQANSAG